MLLMRISSARRGREPNRPPDHNPVAFPEGPTAPQRAHGSAGPGENLAGASLRRACIAGHALHQSPQQHAVAPPDRASSWIDPRTRQRNGLRFSSCSPSDWRVVARAAQDQKGKPESPVQRAKRAIPVRLARRVRLAHWVRKGTRALPGRLVRRQRRRGRSGSSVQAARPRPAPRPVTRMRCW